MDMIKFKYELDSIFRINNKMIIEIRIAIILIETMNNDFE